MFRFQQKMFFINGCIFINKFNMTCSNCKTKKTIFKLKKPQKDGLCYEICMNCYEENTEDIDYYYCNSTSEKILIQFDGGSRGNPGISGAGSVLFTISRYSEGRAIPGRKIFEVSTFLGEKFTNNESEYLAVIGGLKLANQRGYRNVEIQGDSMLVINQLSGKWKVKSPNLIPFVEQVKTLVENDFDEVTFIHIYRNNNSIADGLANLAMDTKCDTSRSF